MASEIEEELAECWRVRVLGTRLKFMLRNNNITKMEELLAKSEAELLREPNFGRRTLDFLIRALAKRGLRLRGPYEPDPPRSQLGLWVSFDY